MTFVLDASVTMAWCFEDEASPATDAVLHRLADEPAVVPALWPLEVSNVLLSAQRRGRMSEAQATRFVDLLGRLPIDVEMGPLELSALLHTRHRHELSAYDAPYLLLAQRLGFPLATLDEQLAGAAMDAGVALVIEG